MAPFTQFRGTLLPDPRVVESPRRNPLRMSAGSGWLKLKRQGRRSNLKERRILKTLREELVRAAPSVPPEEEIPFGDLEAKGVSGSLRYCGAIEAILFPIKKKAFGNSKVFFRVCG